MTTQNLQSNTAQQSARSAHTRTLKTGTLPDGWVETTLGSVISLIGGGTPKTSHDEYWGGDIPWLSVVDFKDGNRWVSKTEKTITSLGLEESSTNLLDTGDLIISARGTVGALAQLSISMAFNQSCYGIKEVESISNNDFLFYLMKYSIMRISRNVHGAVFDTITRKTFDCVNITLPPLPEQKAIADVLSSFDNKIGLLLEQNKTLEQTTQTIFNEWFGKYSPDRPDELPKGWRVGKIGEENFSRVIGSGIEQFDFEKTYLATADVDGNNVTNVNTKITYENRPSRANMQPIEKSIFFAKMQDSRKMLMFDDFSKKNIESMILSTGFAGIKTTELSHYYLWNLVLSSEFDNLKNNLANGAVQVALNNATLKKIEIIIPDDRILIRFNDLIKPLFKKIFINEEQIQSLTQTRDTLLPKLMKGDIRMKFK